MRISLKQTILISTALTTMHLPLMALDLLPGTPHLGGVRTSVTLFSPASDSSAPTHAVADANEEKYSSLFYNALGFPAALSTDAETFRTQVEAVLTQTAELLALKNTSDLNKMYGDYVTREQVSSTETGSELIALTEMQPCDYGWSVRDPEENAANGSVIDAIYPLTGIDFSDSFNLRKDRLTLLNTTHRAIIAKETAIHEQRTAQLKAENLSTTTHLNTEYGARIKGLTDTISIHEKSVGSEKSEITSDLRSSTENIVSRLESDKKTAESSLRSALEQEKKRYVQVLEEEATRFSEKSKSERDKFRSRLFDYALTRQTISTLIRIMNGYKNTSAALNEAASVRPLDPIQLELMQNSISSIADIKGNILIIESFAKAMYPFSRGFIDTVTNKPFWGLGSLLGLSTKTKNIRFEITGESDVPLEKAIPLAFPRESDSDSTVRDLMQYYVETLVTKSAAYQNALNKGYLKLTRLDVGHVHVATVLAAEAVADEALQTGVTRFSLGADDTAVAGTKTETKFNFKAEAMSETDSYFLTPVAVTAFEIVGKAAKAVAEEISINSTEPSTDKFYCTATGKYSVPGYSATIIGKLISHDLDINNPSEDPIEISLESFREIYPHIITFNTDKK